MPFPPAPGFRDAGVNGRSGALMFVGDSGYGWSSAFSGTGGVFLSFDAQGLNPGSAYYRAGGRQLRCLSHPQGVLMAVSIAWGRST